MLLLQSLELKYLHLTEIHNIILSTNKIPKNKNSITIQVSREDSLGGTMELDFKYKLVPIFNVN